jgi:hypothetical protein
MTREQIVEAYETAVPLLEQLLQVRRCAGKADDFLFEAWKRLSQVLYLLKTFVEHDVTQHAEFAALPERGITDPGGHEARASHANRLGTLACPWRVSQ